MITSSPHLTCPYLPGTALVLYSSRYVYEYKSRRIKRGQRRMPAGTGMPNHPCKFQKHYSYTPSIPEDGWWKM